MNTQDTNKFKEGDKVVQIEKSEFADLDRVNQVLTIIRVTACGRAISFNDVRGVIAARFMKVLELPTDNGFKGFNVGDKVVQIKEPYARVPIGQDFPNEILTISKAHAGMYRFESRDNKGSNMARFALVERAVIATPVEVEEPWLKVAPNTSFTAVEVGAKILIEATVTEVDTHDALMTLAVKHDDNERYWLDNKDVKYIVPAPKPAPFNIDDIKEGMKFKFSNKSVSTMIYIGRDRTVNERYVFNNGFGYASYSAASVNTFELIED